MKIKLLNSDLTTYGGQRWVVGEWRDAAPGHCRHCTPTAHCRHCTPTALHGYTSPELAVLLNPIHGQFVAPVAYEYEHLGEHYCDGLKTYMPRQRIIGEPITLPVFTTRQRVVFAIHATRLVLRPATIPEWDTWADAYLRGDETAEVWLARAEAWAWAAEAAEAAGSTFDGFAFAAKLQTCAVLALEDNR